jgi:hypothetical protein
MNEENSPEQAASNPYRNTIGSIVSWAIFRAALIIFAALVIFEYVYEVNYFIWWSVTLVCLYAFVLHPIQVQYRLYKMETDNVMQGTLCSSCKHFEPTGVLCSVLDEHVTENYIPCEGLQWEPRSGVEKFNNDLDEL